MDLLPLFEPWWRFGAALLIGALIGLEREFVQQKSGDPDFAGIRTFSLMSLLGAVAAFFAAQFGIWLFVAAYVGLALLIWVSHLGDLYRGEHEGITTEVVGLLVPFIGAMVVWDYAELAAALGVIAAFVLASKSALHGLARRMSALDLRATLEFALITAVVLPLLPNENYGPFGVLNPSEIWLLVVLVSAISFLGYILIKVLGAERGIGLMGVLGGLVSSTAVTLSFSGRSRDNPKLSGVFAIAIVLASTIMFPRVLVEVAAVYPPLLTRVAWPIGAMLIAGLLGAFLLWRRAASGENDAKAVELGNPLRLTTAISFALVFALVIVVVRAANEVLGDTGVYLASILTGLADVDAITLSVSELTAAGKLEADVASIAILLAVLVNTMVKAGAATFLGSTVLRGIILRVFALILGVGVIAGILTQLLQV